MSFDSGFCGCDLHHAAVREIEARLNGLDAKLLGNSMTDSTSASFMRQWTTAKRQNPDALLFFRIGDFYELFYDFLAALYEPRSIIGSGAVCALPCLLPDRHEC